MIYGYIYDFFFALIGDGTGDFAAVDLADIMFHIGAIDLRFNVWLCHTLTIISIILIFIFLIMFIKWLFKFTAGLFKW